MALQCLFSALTVSPSHRASLPISKNPYKLCTTKSIRCIATPSTRTELDDAVKRRSANYQPSSWDYEFVKSLSSDYTKERYASEVDKLKGDVTRLISGDTDVPLAKLELIDAVQRIGLKSKFENEIKKAMEFIYSASYHEWVNDDLYATALRFRLFRQHGYHVPQDVFEKFRDETGNFKASLCKDVKGLLSLYEASFLGFHGEDIIDQAKTFATTQLKNFKGDLSPSMLRKVQHALEMPLHWKLPRLEARWFIETYEQEPNVNPNLLKLAKLDFNITQSIYQKEVGILASWWTDLGLDKSFTRDRLMEHYFWANGMVSEPQYEASRSVITRISSLITVIDDIYDVYGSMEELELFTDFVDRWDISEVDQLPYDIKIVFLALFNTTNEIGYETLKEQKFNIIPYLSKQWAYLCKSYLKEAKWFHNGCKPTLEEYLENGVVSIGAPIMLFGSYFANAQQITMEAIDYIDKLPSCNRCPSLVLRLTNDLGTSSDELARGDNLKAVQCYMNDTGASEEVAREYMENLVHETWKTLNKEILEKLPFSEPIKSAIPNLARATQCMYQYGDGHGIPDRWTKDNLTLLLVEPVPLN